ncbi:hypothetical protein AAFC00_001383 [Neodothiora populina]|uniref:DNA-directed RNA polymerase III subunit Rpc5 n=1 Tax=Neodothiora populina TaxID=2781224 RepID=A0ABR3PPS4_9PEZI
MAPGRTHEDDDPVTAEYDVYVTPASAEQMYLLQYPVRARHQPYNERHGARPTEMRIKPQAGFIEMDVQLNTSANFNKFQGLVWGDAMRKAQAAGNATYGAAAGFAPAGAPKGRGRGAGGVGGEASSMEAIDSNLSRFNDSLNRNIVYTKQTLGGQIVQDETGNPNYMLGAFRGNELHLTRLDGIVQMRPQFHNVDAVVHQETAARRSEAADERKPAQAMALAQTYKDNRDIDNLEGLRAKNLLLLAQEEKWTKFNYFDEDEPESFEAYHERLFVPETESAAHLKSTLTNEAYLDAISAPRIDPSGRKKKRPLTKKQMTAIEQAEDDVEVRQPDDDAADAVQ